MKTYYKNKILINGLFPMVKYKIDGYIEKTGKYDENIVDINHPDSIFYRNGHLSFSTYSPKDKDGIFYEYFENDELFELDVDEETFKDNYKLQKFYLKKIIEQVSRLELKLRLITNLNIGLPIFKVTIYDKNKDVITYAGYSTAQSSNLMIWDYNDKLKELLGKRLEINISDKALLELEEKNDRFKRAMSFYNSSFLPIDKSIRFVLLFSALEALFNLNEEDKIITDEISRYASKIQFLSSKKEKNMYYKIADYYDIRSTYIHGNNPRPITTENEFDLREIVRKVLIIYWYISLNNMINNSEEMKMFLNRITQKNLSLGTQMFIKCIFTLNYRETYKEISNKLSKGDTNILC